MEKILGVILLIVIGLVLAFWLFVLFHVALVYAGLMVARFCESLLRVSPQLDPLPLWAVSGFIAGAAIGLYRAGTKYRAPRLKVIAVAVPLAIFVTLVFISWKRGPRGFEHVAGVPAAQENLDPVSTRGVQPPAGPGVIAFVSNRDGNREIYVMKPDGSAQRNLTNHPADDWDPIWSPEGTRLLFRSSRDKWGEYFVMDCKGRDLRKVIDRKEIEPTETPCWSPNGKWILTNAGTSTEESIRKNHGLHLYDVETGKRVKVQDPLELENLGRYIEPAWSPDGLKIAFRTYEHRPDTPDNREGRTRIWTMNPDGSSLVALTDELFIKGGPWWMPNSRDMVFTVHEGWDRNKGKICLLDVERKKMVEMQAWDELDGMAAAPDPEGGVVAFFNSSCVYVSKWVGRTWSEPKKVDFAAHPTWSPDGARLAFTCSGHGSGQQIHVVNADGTGGRVRLTPTPSLDYRQPVQYDSPARRASTNTSPSWSSASWEYDLYGLAQPPGRRSETMPPPLGGPRPEPPAPLPSPFAPEPRRIPPPRVEDGRTTRRPRPDPSAPGGPPGPRPELPVAPGQVTGESATHDQADQNEAAKISREDRGREALERNALALVEEGRQAWKAKKYREARTAFEEAHKVQGSDGEAARLLRELRKEAVLEYNLALNLQRRSPAEALQKVVEVMERLRPDDPFYKKVRAFAAELGYKPE